MVQPWAQAFRKEIDFWSVIFLDVSGDNPAEAKRVRGACTYLEVAQAWCNSRSKMEGIGFEVR